MTSFQTIYICWPVANGWLACFKINLAANVVFRLEYARKLDEHLIKNIRRS